MRQERNSGLTYLPRLDWSLRTASLPRESFDLRKAQLSQRDRGTFRVVENFAKLLKIKRNFTAEQGVRKFLLEFHCNYTFMKVKCA